MGLSLLQRLRLWLTRNKARFGTHTFTKTRTEFQTSALQVQTPAATVVVSGVRLVFGLEWNPLPADVGVGTSLQEARNAGYNYGAVMTDNSLVGYARELGPGKGKPYSAVLILVEQLSSSEVEAFIFQLGQQFCFVGLVDRKPINGFDLLLPSLEEALAILVEFRSIHVGHEIRITTNLSEVLPTAEQVRVEALLTSLTPQLLVRRLINRPLRRAVGTVILVIVLIAGAIGWYLYEQIEERKRQEEAARIARESDPDFVYERAIAAILSNAGTPGNKLLQQWRDMVTAMPLTHGGWMLAKIECQRFECKATWVRFHGNFSDFDQKKPANAIESAELGPAPGDDLLKMSLETHHQLPPDTSELGIGQAEKPVTGLDRNALPLAREATLQWGSLLQNWSLLNVNTKLGNAVLFGPVGQTDPTPIKKPVVKLSWEVVDDIWSLPAANLPDYAIPETLLVTVNGLNIHYKLTGALYAKAKKF